MIKEINVSVKVLMNEIEKFIEEFNDEFEFVVDIEDMDLWEIDFENKSFNISECCSVFVRENDDDYFEKWFVEEDIVNKKVKLDNCVLYIFI